MILLRDVQLRTSKSLIKSTILFWSTSESARACWGHRHITWHSDFNFARTIGWKSYRQDGCRVCSALWIVSAIVWRFQNKVWRCFNVIQMNFDYCERNMDSFTSDEGTVKTMDFIRWTSSEEDKNRKGHSFLGSTRYNSITFHRNKRSMAITTHPWTVSTTF